MDNRGTAAVLDRTPEFEGRKFAGAGLTRLRASNSGDRAFEIQVSTIPFEAAFFSVTSNPDQPPHPAGLSVLRIPEVVNAGDRMGVAAIDFGTTNTGACLNDTVPLRLAARIVHPVESASNKGFAIRTSELNQKCRDFLPAAQRAGDAGCRAAVPPPADADDRMRMDRQGR